MSEYVKDAAHPAGWKSISYRKTSDSRGTSADNANLNPDAMDEAGDEGGSDIEPDPN